MGWWKDRWDSKKVEVGDEPIDLIHEMLRAFADSYIGDVGRKPVTPEFLFSLSNALQTTGRELFDDLEAREVVSVNLATREATKIQEYAVGDYFVVPLKTEFAYGRIIGYDAAGSIIEIYRLKTKIRLSFTQLQHRALPVLFQTHVNGFVGFRDRRWSILGHADLPKKHPMPSFRLGSQFTFWMIARGTKQWAATTEEVLRLEPCICWNPETVEERISSDHPDSFPEMEEGKCGDFGDAYLRILHEPGKIRSLHLAFAEVTDAGLRHLAQCSQLKTLNLSSRPITDTGLKHVAVLASLEELNLGRSRITDAGLRHLHGLKNLRKLGLMGTAVSDKGIAHLKKALPGVTVER